MEVFLNNQCMLVEKPTDLVTSALKQCGFELVNEGTRLIAPISDDTINKLESIIPSIASVSTNDGKTLRNSKMIEYYRNYQTHIKTALAAGERFKPLDSTNGVKFNMNYYYKPFKHQKKALLFALTLPSCALFLETGTGKTYVVTQVVRYRIAMNLVKRVLVIAPRSILDTAWMKDFNKFAPDVSTFNWYQPKKHTAKIPCPVCKQKLARGEINTEHKCFKKLASKKAILNKHPEMNWRHKYLSNDAQVFVLNPDGYKAVDHFIKPGDFDMIVIDESTIMRSHKTVITQTLLNSAYKYKYRMVMSGCPTPNSPAEFWPQMSFINYMLSANFFRFRAKYMTPRGSIRTPDGRVVDAQWDLNPAMADELTNTISPYYIRFTKDEALDLPPRLESVRKIDMDPAHKRAYKQMADDLVTVINDTKLSAKTKLSSLTKLMQLAAGFAYDKDGNPVKIDNNSKLVELKSLLLELNNKTIIWSNHRFIINDLEQELAGYNPVKIYGNMPPKLVKTNSDRFIEDPSCKIMIANPMCAKFGHTWVVAPYSIFYSVGWSWEAIHQSMDRNYRIGQDKSVTLIYLLMTGTIDVGQKRLMKKKKSITDLLLDEKDTQDVINMMYGK